MTESYSRNVNELKIQVPWGVIALKCWNSPESNPVLVAHGLGENAGAFDRLIGSLSTDFFYVVVDLPGHGYSSPFPQGLSLDFMNYVSQLQRVVNHFRWKKLSLMGHSFGAHLLEFFAATYTKKIERLILIDGIAPTPVAREIFLLYYRNQVRDALQFEKKMSTPTEYTYEEALAQFSNRRMSKLKLEAAKPLLERCLRKNGNKYTFTADYRARMEIRPAVGEDVIFDILKKIKCPVLVILGKNSEMFWLFNSHGYYATTLKILEKTHPASCVARVSGNHCVHNNEPEVVAPLVNKFLTHHISKY